MEYNVWVDGAYSQWNKRGGCSFLILTNNTHIGSKSVRVELANPTHAETVAVGLAASFLLESGIKFTRQDVVIFNVDCQSTVTFCNKYLRSGKTYVNSNEKLVIDNMLTLKKLSEKCRITFEKVKGHKDVLNPNTYVDRLAKIAIRRE